MAVFLIFIKNNQVDQYWGDDEKINLSFSANAQISHKNDIDV